MTQSSDDHWYLYENDVHGINALQQFESRDALIAYVRDAEFVEDRFSDNADEARAEVRAAVDAFAAGTLDAPGFADALTQAYSAHGSELECAEVESFDSVCTGQSGFAEEAIEIFCDEAEIEPVTQIDASLRPAFKRFFETANEVWIG